MHGNVVMSLYATVATGCNDCNGCNRHVSDEEMKSTESTESTEDAFPQIPMPVAWSSEALNGIDMWTLYDVVPRCATCAIAPWVMSQVSSDFCLAGGRRFGYTASRSLRMALCALGCGA